MFLVKTYAYDLSGAPRDLGTRTCFACGAVLEAWTDAPTECVACGTRLGEVVWNNQTGHFAEHPEDLVELESCPPANIKSCPPAHIKTETR